jgi:hypothetical protein
MDAIQAMSSVHAALSRTHEGGALAAGGNPDQIWGETSFRVARHRLGREFTFKCASEQLTVHIEP